MKTSTFIITLPVFILATAISTDFTHAQTAASPVSGSNPSQPTLPPPTPYAVVSRDANSAIWEQTTYELSPSGQVVPTAHRYTELASGLNFWSNGQWTPSKEVIAILPNGTAAATNGQHQVYFPGDIAEGVIELDTPDGLKLQSRPIALSYDDGSNTVLFAVLTDATGAILPSTNQVIYQNAFTGVDADLLYTYTKGGFEQDIILRAQPPTPDSFGLNPQTARLQVLTEFFNPPRPGVTAMTVPTAAGNLEDDSLSFGTMQIGPGKAFLLGTNSSQVGVNKQWLTLNGGQFLVEEVPVAALAVELAQLPASPTLSIKPNPPLNVVSRKHLLPTQRPFSVPGKHAMQLAQNIPMSRGLVLDYVTLNSNQTNYTFQCDTTYYISGPFYSYGTNTFEGGAVLKYAANGSVQIQSVRGYSPAINWQGGPYRPVIFTAKDDNSVGTSIGTGSPIGYYGNPMLMCVGISSPTSGTNLTGMRFCYAGTAIQLVSTFANIYDAQFVNCGDGASLVISSLFLGNSLFTNTKTNFLSQGASTFNVQNTTFHNSWYVVQASTTYAGSTAVFFTNCIFAQVINVFRVPNYPGDPRNAFSVATGDYNGFYQTSFFGGSHLFVSPVYPFQSVGAGNYYLANGSAFSGQGTPNIDPALVVDLRNKTTYPPPQLNPPASVPDGTTWTPLVPRDTDYSPDLGYHYDPLDYCVSGQSLSGTLTLDYGVAVGIYGSTGFQNGTLASIGTPLYHNRLCLYSAVQEQPNSTLGSVSATYFMNPSATTALNWQFTDLFLAGSTAFLGSQTVNTISLTDCYLHCFGISVQYGYYLGHAFTNNILERCYFSYISMNSPGYPVSFCNNLLLNSSFTCCCVGYSSFAQFVSLLNNLFVKGNLAYCNSPLVANNGYYNCSVSGGYGLNPQLLATLDFQRGPLGPYYYPNSLLASGDLFTLVDAGSGPSASFGLDNYTTRVNQQPDTGTVDIGYHYAIIEPPVAYDDPNEYPCENNAYDIYLSIYAYDPYNLTLTYIVVTPPTHGTLSNAGSGHFIYTPNSCYEGTDSFTFKVSDGFLDSNTATVTLTIGDTVTAYPPPVQTCRNTTSAQFTLGGDDNCGEQLTYTIFSNPTYGYLTGEPGTATDPTYTYTPTDPNFTGTDSFTYKVSNECGDSSTATVAITVAGAPAVIPAPIRSGFDLTVFQANDDNSIGPIGLPFMINFFGSDFSSLYVNENGNITFNGPFDITSQGALSYDPNISLAAAAIQTGLNIIAPFWGDVDTRSQCSALVTYATNYVSGHVAFGVNWAYVGYYDEQVDKLNAFQMIMIDRSDIAAGDFDVEFNYDQIQWESGAASRGPNGLGGDAARAGYASPSNSGFEFNCSSINCPNAQGALLDSNLTTGLIHNSFNSGVPPVNGRYVFQFRDGFPLGHP